MARDRTSSIVARRKAVLRKYHGGGAGARITRGGVSRETGTIPGTAGLTPSQLSAQQSRLRAEQEAVKKAAQVKTAEETLKLKATEDTRQARQQQEATRQLMETRPIPEGMVKRTADLYATPGSAQYMVYYEEAPIGAMKPGVTRYGAAKTEPLTTEEKTYKKYIEEEAKPSFLKQKYAAMEARVSAHITGVLPEWRKEGTTFIGKKAFQTPLIKDYAEPFAKGMVLEVKEKPVRTTLLYGGSMLIGGAGAAIMRYFPKAAPVLKYGGIGMATLYGGVKVYETVKLPKEKRMEFLGRTTVEALAITKGARTGAKAYKRLHSILTTPGVSPLSKEYWKIKYGYKPKVPLRFGKQGVELEPPRPREWEYYEIEKPTLPKTKLPLLKRLTWWTKGRYWATERYIKARLEPKSVMYGYLYDYRGVEYGLGLGRKQTGLEFIPLTKQKTVLSTIQIGKTIPKLDTILKQIPITKQFPIQKPFPIQKQRYRTETITKPIVEPVIPIPTPRVPKVPKPPKPPKRFIPSFFEDKKYKKKKKKKLMGLYLPTKRGYAPTLWGLQLPKAPLKFGVPAKTFTGILPRPRLKGGLK